MPYYSRRYSSRKYPLSKKNIYMNRSGRSQAYQIAALSNKLSALNRAVRPEIKVLQGTPATFTFTSSTLSGIYNSFGVIQPALGTNANQRVGDKIYEKNINVQMYFEYSNSSDTGYHNTESAGATVRIFAVQSKDPGSPTTGYSLDEFISSPAHSGAAYNILAIKPFRDHISESWKILYDRYFTITSAQNQKLFEFNIHPGRLEFDVSGNHNFVQVYMVVSGLHADADFQEKVQATCNVKCVYTDM